MCQLSTLAALPHGSKVAAAVPGVHLHTTLTGERKRDHVLELSVKSPKTHSDWTILGYILNCKPKIMGRIWNAPIGLAEVKCFALR